MKEKITLLKRITLLKKLENILYECDNMLLEDNIENSERENHLLYYFEKEVHELSKTCVLLLNEYDE